MEQQKNLQVNYTMTYGAITGGALVIFSILLYISGNYLNDYLGYFNYLILIIGIIIGTKNFRDKELNGNMPYSKALGTGTLIALFSSIILAFYNFIFLKFVDPQIITEMQKMAEEAMLQRGMSADEVENAMQMQSKMMTPGWISIFVIPVMTFFGFIFSLITSIFLKKEVQQNPFEQV